MPGSQKENSNTNVKPVEVNRWENEGGNPAPRNIQAKNEDYRHKLVRVFKGMLLKISRPASAKN